MPELPEVEVTRLSFAKRIAGAEIKNVRLGKPLRWPLQCNPEDLTGQIVVEVRRRGKYLLLDLRGGGVLLLHLGMSGSVLFDTQLPPAGVHDHFDMQTSHGLLRLHDPRRFGAVVFAPSEQSAQAQKLLGKLGVEPLGEQFDLATFAQALAQRKAPIKQVLLGGAVVVGVGNIYASEALFWAGIHPTVSASALSQQRIARLHVAIRDVLTRALEHGGSTLRNFSNAQGQNGHFQLQTMVYGRAAESCRSCGTTVLSIRQGQRSTFFCPNCQKP
jgi:formamidopyrimidine-DNA glycosylase